MNDNNDFSTGVHFTGHNMVGERKYQTLRNIFADEELKHIPIWMVADRVIELLAEYDTLLHTSPSPSKLSEADLYSACYSYRHDFGLLDETERTKIFNEADRWARAFDIKGNDNG